MLCSPDRQFIFIATPKTASTAIETHLSTLDPAILRDAIPLEGGGTQRVRKHARAVDIRNALGASAAGYTFIAFMRDPREVVVSKYYWYRNGWPAERLKAGQISSLRRRRRRWYRPNLADRVWLARLFPVTLWALVYPLKPGAWFLCDDAGALLIDELGAYSRLQTDFTKIFSRFGYAENDLVLPHINVSRYENQTLSRDLLSRVVEKRMPRDASLNANAEQQQ